MKLVNAANLHSGGGMQVATSVISELLAMGGEDDSIAIVASTEVMANLDQRQSGQTRGLSLDLLDVAGFNWRDRRAAKLMDGFDTVLTLFGPLYRFRTRFRSIVGFAQAWIIYPDNECYARLSVMERLKARAKFAIQRFFFKRADVLVVELEHVKQGLIRELGIAPERIHVIHNCLSAIYRDRRAWPALALPDAVCDLRLGFVGRNYPHKNTEIFPAIRSALRLHGIEAKFFVTFTEEEWRACTPAFRDACVNVGPLTVRQCPGFYQALDGVVFPSLLECFSATPLEAMAMQKPLFASDRPFNRDVCQQHAHYFDPLAPETAAREIARVFAAGGADTAGLLAARDHAIDFASPEDRARKYMALLDGRAESIWETEC
ncbi:MAG: glycosyltransferase [Sphingomonas sp.]